SDAMRHDTAAISIPAACKEFTITLRHTGTLPVAAMGHDVVIASAADMPGVLADGVAAGLDNGYVKPGDPRVVAHTRLVGGGETASVTFPVAKLAKDGPWVVFCSFPGHSALMKGPLPIRCLEAGHARATPLARQWAPPHSVRGAKMKLQATLIAAACALALAACGNDAPPPAPATDAVTPAADEATPATDSAMTESAATDTAMTEAPDEATAPAGDAAV